MKKEKEKTVKETAAVERIIQACKELNWSVAVPDKKKINYLVIGQPKKIDKIICKIIKK